MRYLLVIVWFLFIPFLVFSQQIERKQLVKYTQGEGLSSYNIRKIIQDNKGFMWVATQDGLNRFDGRVFTHYTKNSISKHQISGVDIRDLIEDTARHLLWVLPGEVGINAVDIITGNVVVTQPIPFTNTERWNICMIKNDDQLWIGTSIGIIVYNTLSGKFEELPAPAIAESLSDFEVRSLLKDEHGRIWACYSGYGIVVYDASSRKKLKEVRLSQLNEHIGNNNIRFYNALLYDKGSILYATSHGLRKIVYDKYYITRIDNFPCKPAAELNTSNVNYVTKGMNDEVLIAGNNRLYRFNAALTQFITMEEPSRIGETNWLGSVYCIFRDYENNIWLGCQEGLAFLSRFPSPFAIYSYDQITNTKLDHVRSIYPLNSDTIIAGLQDGMVLIDKTDNKFSKFYTGALYHHILYDKYRHVHVARHDGMFVLKHTGLVPVDEVYPEFRAFSKIPINSHLSLSDSVLILGTESDDGILIWNMDNHSVRNITGGKKSGSLASDIVNNIYCDSARNVWVLSDNVITILSPDLKQSRTLLLRDSSNDAPYGLYFDMCETNDFYWIAAYGTGIIQLNKAGKIEQIFNTKKGLSNDGIYQIYNLLDKQLLVTSNYGLSVLDVKTGRFRKYYLDDGLHSNGFEEVCGLWNSNFIYAGGVNGFTVINPFYFRTNTVPPKLYFGSIKTETKSGVIDTMNVQLNELVIPDDWLRTTISFSGLNYINSKRVNYQYKIREIDSSWIDIGDQQFISVIGLHPGTYHLQVQAANEDGVWSAPIELTLIFLPKWYQTWWFKTMVVLLLLGILYSLYRYRLAQIRKEQQIRQRIASDLHDDIGSTLNSVKVFTNLALMKPENNITYLQQLKEGVQNAIVGVRDMVWVLDDKQDTLGHFLERVELFINPLASAQDIRFEKSLDAPLAHILLKKEEKRNLYLIIKEALNNSIKYASATTLQLIVEKVSHDRYIITIRDNGKGFDRDLIQKGNGLNNLQYRAQQIKYAIEIDSVPGKGTTITLTRP